MALKTIVESLDEVPEALHEEYVERDGKYVLQIEGVDSHPTVVNLKTAHEKTKTKNRELSSELEQARGTLERFEGVPEDFDTEKYEELLARAEAQGGEYDESELAERLERQKATLESKHSKELEAERKRTDSQSKRGDKLEGQLRRVMIDEGLTKAMLDAGIGKQHIGPLRSYLKDRGKIRLVESDEDDGTYQVFADDGVDEQTPLAKFVTDWSSTEEGSLYVEKPTGGGAGGGDGQRFADNPWDDKGGKVRPNLTKQQEIIAANPEKARQMARAAGSTPNW